MNFENSDKLIFYTLKKNLKIKYIKWQELQKYQPQEELAEILKVEELLKPKGRGPVENLKDVESQTTFSLENISPDKDAGRFWCNHQSFRKSELKSDTMVHKDAGEKTGVHSTSTLALRKGKENLD